MSRAGPLLSALLLLPAPAAEAAEHVVREGETLAQLAQLYYGDGASAVVVLAAANGFADPDDAELVAGQRISVLVPGHAIVAAGETWEALAERTLGSGRRARVLAEANGGTVEADPDTGVEIVVPIVLTHIPGRRAKLATIARRYYGGRRGATRRLRRYNGLRFGRPPAGRPILVPFPDLHLSAGGAEALDRAAGARSDGKRAEVQAEIAEALPALDDLFQEGEYMELAASASRLLGRPEATGNQRVTLNRMLAYAYVALEREDLAEAALREALRHQPDLELNPITTSPKILRVLRRARQARGAPAKVPTEESRPAR